MKKLLILYICILLPNLTYSQDENDFNPIGLKFLEYVKEIPEDLLSTRSAILLNLPNNWGEKKQKEIIQQTHTSFQKMGIDAIMYASIQDIFAGKEITQEYYQNYTSREIKNIIIVSYITLKIGEKEYSRYVIIITPFSKNKNIINHAQKAWKKIDDEYEPLLKNLGKIIFKSKIPNKNFLITDTPNFFDAPKIVKTYRYQNFHEDLKYDKILIPKFEEIQIPKTRPTGIINDKIQKEIENYNENIPELNKKLTNAFANYHMDYEIRNYDEADDKKFIQEGFRFVLHVINTSGIAAHRLLGYEIDPTDTEYTLIKQENDKTIIRTIPINANIYKFYIKHLQTKDIFLGNQWDGDEKYFESLNLFIKNIKDELKVK
ncbi:MAG: hypothetical protein QM536_09270 [Chitinophagaceae bacterium]|nr:hypothetical protein [Chitinophagaceae bacterium]